MSPGPLALVGSGEYLPVMAGVEAVLGIDEETALVDMTGTGRDWQVHGRQQVWVLGDGPRRGYPPGSALHTP
jgi:hypothetical protein